MFTFCFCRFVSKLCACFSFSILIQFQILFLPLKLNFFCDNTVCIRIFYMPYLYLFLTLLCFFHHFGHLYVELCVINVIRQKYRDLPASGRSINPHLAIFVQQPNRVQCHIYISKNKKSLSKIRSLKRQVKQQQQQLDNGTSY